MKIRNDSEQLRLYKESVNKTIMKKDNKKKAVSRNGNSSRSAQRRNGASGTRRRQTKRAQSGRAAADNRRRRRKQKGAGSLLAVILILAVLGIGVYSAYQYFGKTSTEDYVQKGVQMLQVESYESAIDNFEKAIANEQKRQEKGRDATLTESGTPYITEAYRGLGMVYYAQKDYEQARTSLQQVIDLGGEPTPVLYNLMGLAAMYQEDYDGALNAFEAGTALPAKGTYRDTANTEQTADYSAVIQEMKFNRIVCFEKKLDWANAKAEMEAYIAAYPGDTSAQKEAEFLATR